MSPQSKIQKNCEKDNLSENLNVGISTIHIDLVVFYKFTYNFISVILAIEKDAEILITSLKHENLLWPEIEEIWKKTTGYHLKKLETINYSPS